MPRFYAATGDGIARLDEAGDAWEVEVSLDGSGAQCLALDPSDPDTLYAGLREDGLRRTTDGGRTWVDCALPAPGVFSLAVSAAFVRATAPRPVDFSFEIPLNALMMPTTVPNRPTKGAVEPMVARPATPRFNSA